MTAQPRIHVKQDTDTLPKAIRQHLYHASDIIDQLNDTQMALQCVADLLHFNNDDVVQREGLANLLDIVHAEGDRHIKKLQDLILDATYEKHPE